MKEGVGGRGCCWAPGKLQSSGGWIRADGGVDGGGGREGEGFVVERQLNDGGTQPRGGVGGDWRRG